MVEKMKAVRMLINTNRSTLSAILFHFSINFSGEFLTPPEQAKLYQLLLTGLMAVADTLILGTTHDEPRAGRQAGHLCATC